MPIIGWLGGTILLDLISDVDHWIAFALLSLIGRKMLFEVIKRKSGEEKADPSSGYVLLTLSIATSIDALAVGVGFSFLRVVILFPAVVIGIVPFVMSFFSVYLGDRFGQYFGSKIEIVGGFILIGTGVKTLLEHIL